MNGCEDMESQDRLTLQEKWLFEMKIENDDDEHHVMQLKLRRQYHDQKVLCSGSHKTVEIYILDEDQRQINDMGKDLAMVG